MSDVPLHALDGYPRPAAGFHELLDEVLMCAERDGRIVYVPDCEGWSEFVHVLRYNRHVVAPPKETEVECGGPVNITEWSYRAARYVIEQSDQFDWL